MGKKTNEFMAAVDKLIGECMEPLRIFLGYADLVKDITAKMARNLDEYEQMQRDVLRVIVSGDLAKPNRKPTKEDEERANADPRLIAIGKAGEKLFEQKVDASNELKKARTELFKAVKALNDKLTAFKTYVFAKEKSRNPFKSKASIPVAKDVIRKGDEAVDEILKLT